MPYILNIGIFNISFNKNKEKKYLLIFFIFLMFFSFFKSKTIFAAVSSESNSCIYSITQVEKELHIPDGFLEAMGRVESGRLESDGIVRPWPWTVTASGQGHYYVSKEEAISAVREFQMRGIHSIDVGCMQINLQQHPDAFSSLDVAFNPLENAHYAGNFLIQMYNHMGSWPRAAAAYHSQTPDIGTPYQWKVLEAWATPQDLSTAAKKANHSSFGGQKNGGLYSFSAPISHYGGNNIVHNFHPFMGNGHYSSLPPPHHVAARGRDLASYRSAPVMLAAPLH